MSLPKMSEFAGTVEALAGAVAQRAGSEGDDFAARMLAGAVAGVITAAAPRPAEPDTDLTARFDAALAIWKLACHFGLPHPASDGDRGPATERSPKAKHGCSKHAACWPGAICW